MKLVHFNKFGAGGKSPWLLHAQLCCVLFFLFFMGEEAFAWYQPDLMVRLAAEGDGSYLGEGAYEPTADAQSRSQAAFSGSPAQFRILLKNAGDQPDSFILTGPGSGSEFSVSYLDPGGVDRGAALSGGGYRTASLPPGETTVLLLQVTLTRFTLGASYRVAVSAVSVSDPAAVDQVKTETVACGTTAAVTVSAPPDGGGAPGTVVNYPYTVTNVGNEENVFALTAEVTSGWQGVVVADDGAGGGIAGDGVRQSGENSVCVSTGTLPPGGSYGFFVAITVPESGSDGSRGDVVVSVVGEGASGTDRISTSTIAPRLSLSEAVRNLSQGGAFSATAGAVPGDLLQYRMAVTNSGSAAATSVSIDSPIPDGLQLVADSLLIALAPEGEAACAASQCGWARASAGNIVAHLGEGASDAAGGALLPGRTVYLFFKAQVQ